MVFGQAIQANARGKVCCHLSGGHDTRAILSVLLGLKIHTDIITGHSMDGRTTDEDLKIASKIAHKFNLYHFIIECEKDVNRSITVHDACKKYDVVFSGVLISEYFNIWNLHNINRGYQRSVLYNHIPNIFHLLKKCNNLYVPMLDLGVIHSWGVLSLKYKHDCIIQESIIKHYYPSLMDFPFTKSYVTKGFKNKIIEVIKTDSKGIWGIK